MLHNLVIIYIYIKFYKLYKATKLISNINISVKDKKYLIHTYLSNELFFTQNQDKIKH